jgi:hypothetical protein
MAASCVSGSIVIKTLQEVHEQIKKPSFEGNILETNALCRVGLPEHTPLVALPFGQLR